MNQWINADSRLFPCHLFVPPPSSCLWRSNRSYCVILKDVSIPEECIWRTQGRGERRLVGGALREEGQVCPSSQREDTNQRQVRLLGRFSSNRAAKPHFFNMVRANSKYKLWWRLLNSAVGNQWRDDVVAPHVKFNCCHFKMTALNNRRLILFEACCFTQRKQRQLPRRV